MVKVRNKNKKPPKPLNKKQNIQQYTGSLSQYNKEEEVKGIRKKERNVSLFSDDMIVYVDNPKESTEKYWT